MIQALGGNGKVAVLDHPEVESVMLRTKGFTEVMTNITFRQRKIEIVAVMPVAAATGRRTSLLRALKAHPDINGYLPLMIHPRWAPSWQSNSRENQAR